MNHTAVRDRLDEIEQSLPPLPAKVLRFQRDLATRVERETSSAYERIVTTLRRRNRGSAHHGVDESLTRAELYRQAQQRQIAGRSSMNKAELIAALSQS